MATLTLTTPEGEQAHDLTEPQLTIGRGADNAIVVDHDSISGSHAQVTLGDDGQHTLGDLGSTNGTKVNGEAVESVVLSDGDQIAFGDIVGVYRADAGGSEPAPAATAPAAAAGSGAAGVAAAFPRKAKETDTVGSALLFLGGLAILAILAAIASAFTMGN